MFLRELRMAFRTLRKARGYTLAAVLSLALGIGGNVAMFSLLNAVLLRPLGYPHPERLFLIREDMPKFRHFWGLLPVRAGHVLLWRDQLHFFESIGAAYGATLTLTGTDRPARVGAIMMTAEFFNMLGIKPVLGRSFLRFDEKIGAPDVVILSDAFWRRNFGADPNIVGRKIVLDGKPHQVIGVIPRRVPFYAVQWSPPEGAELFVPLRVPPDELDVTKVESGYWSTGILRLKPGITLERERTLNSKPPWPLYLVSIVSTSRYTPGWSRCKSRSSVTREKVCFS